MTDVGHLWLLRKIQAEARGLLVHRSRGVQTGLERTGSNRSFTQRSKGPQPNNLAAWEEPEFDSWGCWVSIRALRPR